MRKKIGFKACCLALIFLMAFGTQIAALAEETVTIAPMVTTDDAIGLQQGSKLVVGSTTMMSGHFGTEAWSSNTADMDARALLHGYGTIAWTRTLGAAINGMVVAGIETAQEGDGSRTYTIELHDDLVYSDGSKITAKDYAFSLLFNGSEALESLGGTPLNMNHIVGYEAYAKGNAKGISGVRLLSDTKFSLRISSDYLPFFYGMAMLNVSPYPMAVIAPGCDAKDDGQGVYISGTFTADSLRKTLLDPKTGYEYNPRITAGPYLLESFDQKSGQATFFVNPKYKGNYEGQKPHIERIVFKHVENDTAMAQLEKGEIDLLNKASNADVIAKGQSWAADEKIQAASYLRTGFSFLSYACEEGPTASAAVRKAVSMCLDVDTLIERDAGNAARRVYGYYGLGQWMATHTSNGEDGNPALNVPEALPELAIEYSVEAAKALLAQDGWTQNASGGAFQEGQDDVRYRDGEALVIRWAKTQGSAIADAVEGLLAPALAQAGVKLEVTEMPFGEMMEYFYRQTDRVYNMFYLATNFSYVFDPYYDFNVADEYQGILNTSGLKDEQLMQLALAMRSTASTDMYGYVTRWLAFQERFVEVLPMMPLYSNVYFDFYTDALQGYDIVSNPGWAHAIPYAYMQD